MATTQQSASFASGETGEPARPPAQGSSTFRLRFCYARTHGLVILKVWNLIGEMAAFLEDGGHGGDDGADGEGRGKNAHAVELGTTWVEGEDGGRVKRTFWHSCRG